MSADIAGKALGDQEHFSAERGHFKAVLGLLAALLIAQLYLVFFKSFNWDEFFHFSHIYRAYEGSLSTSLQGFQFRLFIWAPIAAEEVVDQMRLARFFVWACTLIGLMAIYGLANLFVSKINAIFAVLSYLSAGFVFTQSFSIRADALAATTLMSALYVFSAGRMSYRRAIAAGFLIGIAGLLTIKSVFYAPCFVALAWWRYAQGGKQISSIVQFAAVPVAAAVTFLVILAIHNANLAGSDAATTQSSSMVESASQWFFSAERHTLIHIGRQALWAVVFSLCIMIAPFAWRKQISDPASRIALLGMAAPLIVLFFYRNTFPYFFVFLLAPVAVAIAPSLGLLRDRYGSGALLGLLALSPIALTILEPRDVLQRQEALINYVHDEYETPVPYLAFTGVVPDYPMILPHMAGGPGIDGYFDRGEPLVSKGIEAGELAFTIGARKEVLAALHGRPLPRTFLAKDAESLNSNFVHQWGPLFRAGKAIPSGDGPILIDIPHAGPFILDGQALEIDGRTLVPGDTIILDAGSHEIAGPRSVRSVLWRGEKLPSPPPSGWSGEFYTDY